MVPQMNEKLSYGDFLRQLSYEQTWCDVSLNEIIFVTIVSVKKKQRVIRVEKTLYLPQHHIVLNFESPESVVIDYVPISKL